LRQGNQARSQIDPTRNAGLKSISCVLRQCGGDINSFFARIGYRKARPSKRWSRLPASYDPILLVQLLAVSL
jgi:hypothetical protein